MFACAEYADAVHARNIDENQDHSAETQRSDMRRIGKKNFQNDDNRQQQNVPAGRPDRLERLDRVGDGLIAEHQVHQHDQHGIEIVAAQQISDRQVVGVQGADRDHAGDRLRQRSDQSQQQDPDPRLAQIHLFAEPVGLMGQVHTGHDDDD